MKDIALKDGFVLCMQAYNKKVRVIVLHNNKEYVCRMETLSNLKDFTKKKDARVFKGRLQLYKEEGLINIIPKGTVAGMVDEETFVKYLDGLQW